MKNILVTGGTGYLGRALLPALVSRQHHVAALARPESATTVPEGVRVIRGNVLDLAVIADALIPSCTLVHLVGTPRPSPRKAREFLAIDLASIRAALDAARRVGVAHLVYVSVAHPAPIMKAYIAARREGEALIAASGVPATILRPWYVLGPGRWWPYALVPIYAVLERIPRTRDTARRLGLVTRAQMIAALVHAVESPPASGVRIVDVDGIRRAV